MPFKKYEAINIIRALYGFHSCNLFNTTGSAYKIPLPSNEFESECLKLFNIDDSRRGEFREGKEFIPLVDALDAKIIGFLMEKKQRS